MNKLIAIGLAIGCAPVFAIERGINYDPAHSSAFVKAQGANNLQGMTDEIQRDLQAMKNAGFSTIKTFYSSVSTIDGERVKLLADLACPLGFKMMLGVYEFNPSSDNCSTWCEAASKIQVENAIASVNKYPNCIVGVAVGNEDIYNWNFTSPQSEMQKRIASDISQIKQAIAGKNVPVGSAQQDGAWLQLAKNDPYDIIGKLDFLGVNIYPFWSPEKTNVQNGKEEFNAREQAIKNTPKFQNKVIIITEEGWPSQSSHTQNPNASKEHADNYYQWWKDRAATDTLDSYYFGMYDKQPTNSDADKYFGLCTYDRKAKVISTCE